MSNKHTVETVSFDEKPISKTEEIVGYNGELKYIYYIDQYDENYSIVVDYLGEPLTVFKEVHLETKLPSPFILLIEKRIHSTFSRPFLLTDNKPDLYELKIKQVFKSKLTFYKRNVVRPIKKKGKRTVTTIKGVYLESTPANNLGVAPIALDIASIAIHSYRTKPLQEHTRLKRKRCSRGNFKDIFNAIEYYIYSQELNKYIKVSEEDYLNYIMLMYPYSI